MRKIPPQSAAPSILRRLRVAVARDGRVMELLAHQPSITAEVLELVATLSILDVVTPKLLLEVSRQHPPDGGTSVADALHVGMDLLRSFAPRRRVTPFTRVEDALRFREEVDAEYLAHQERAAEALQRARVGMQAQRRRMDRAELDRRRLLRELDRRPFPPPPVPGTPDIIPLTSVAQLKSEGKEMHHCVGLYGQFVVSGTTYVYRVMAPERATLAIARTEDGCWRRGDIKAKANKKVGSFTSWRYRSVTLPSGDIVSTLTSFASSVYPSYM